MLSFPEIKHKISLEICEILTDKQINLTSYNGIRFISTQVIIRSISKFNVLFTIKQGMKIKPLSFVTNLQGYKNN